VEQYELNWKNYYQILQVSPNASPTAIKLAYKRQAKIYHPDTAADAAAAANMVVINEAYEVLSHPTKRAVYDQIYIAHDIQQKLTEVESIQDDLSALLVVIREAASGRKKQQIVDELEKKGISDSNAEKIVGEVFDSRARLRRIEGGLYIGCGVFALIVAGIMAGIFYTISITSSLYISNLVVVGLVFVGLAFLGFGLFRRFTGRVGGRRGAADE
jgi:curved DNA-binding protein CbpA